MAEVGRQTTDAYAAALVQLCQEWMHGQLDDTPVPPNDEGNVCLRYLENYRRNCGTREIAVAYQELKQFHVDRHLDQAASHRRWLGLWHQLLKVADVDVDEKMQSVVEIHDLSKYSPEEALGYGIMFGETGKFQQLEGRQKELWDLALASHYHNNPHHPQYKLGQTMEEVHLQESVLDMLACRTERTLTSMTSVTPSQLVDIPDKFLDRYIPEDKSKVKVILSRWLNKLEAVIEDSGAGEVIGQWEDETGKKLVLQECSGSENCSFVTGRTMACSHKHVSSRPPNAQCCNASVGDLNKCAS